jgi:hypothetical protein
MTRNWSFDFLLENEMHSDMRPLDFGGDDGITEENYFI